MSAIRFLKEIDWGIWKKVKKFNKIKFQLYHNVNLESLQFS